jgi:hypothetical protein
MKCPQKAPISHHPQPLILILITISSIILRILTRNRISRATAAVGPITQYIGT